MVAKIAGFTEMTMRPVNPSPRLDLIEARFPLCSLFYKVILSRVGSTTILVKTGWGNTAKSWLVLSGIGLWIENCLERFGAVKCFIRKMGAGKLVRMEYSEKDRAGSAGRR